MNHSNLTIETRIVLNGTNHDVIKIAPFKLIYSVQSSFCDGGQRKIEFLFYV